MQDIPLLIKISAALVLAGVGIATIAFMLSTLKNPLETFSIIGVLLVLVLGAAWFINWLGL